MSFARPGYERVRSDTRRPPIPDLPFEVYSTRDGDTDGRYATAAFLSYFAVLLLIGIAVWYAVSARPDARLAVADEHVATATFAAQPAR